MTEPDPAASAPPPAGERGAASRSALDWAQREGAADAVLDRLLTLSATRRRRKRRVISAASALASTLVLAFGGLRISEGLKERRAALAAYEASVALAAEQRARAQEAQLAAARAKALEPPPPMATESAEPEPQLAVLTTATQQELADGSLIELRAGARFSAEFSDALRRVFLHSGTAHFAVVPDAARPFEVVTQGLAIRAVGTAFSVDLEQASLEVLVTEGRVAVSEDSATMTGQRGGAVQPLPPAAEAPALEGSGAPSGSAASPHVAARSQVMLVAGEALRVASDTQQLAVQPLTPAELAAKLSWRVPLLDFSYLRLADLLTQMNRYLPKPIVLNDPELAELRVSGILRANNSAALFEMLRLNFGLEVDSSDASQTLLYGP